MNRRAAVIAGVVGLALALSSRAARAGNDACVGAYEKAQVLRKAGELRGSREQLLICSQDSCPKLVRTDCAQWFTEVTNALPTMVFAVKGGDGSDVVDARVTIDGRPLVDRIDGGAVPVDPGVHTFVAVGPGAARAEQRLVVREGEKDRRVELRFGGPPVIDLPPPRAPKAAYVVGGIGVAALGAFGVFAGMGASAFAAAEHDCKPHCGSNVTDDIHTKFLVADVSLGVGLAALGVATWMFVAKPFQPARPAAGLFVGPHGAGVRF